MFLVRKEISIVATQVYIDPYGHFIIISLRVWEVNLVLVKQG